MVEATVPDQITSAAALPRAQPAGRAGLPRQVLGPAELDATRAAPLAALEPGDVVIIAKLRDQRQRGRYLGGKAPRGWKFGDAGDLLPDPTKRTALKQMRKLRAEGASLRTISDKMKAAGVSIIHQGVKNALAAADRSVTGRSSP